MHWNYWLPQINMNARKTCEGTGSIEQFNHTWSIQWLGDVRGRSSARDLLQCTDSDDIYNYDLKTPNGMKLELKSAKTKMKSRPLPHFECSVCDYNSKQKM